MAVSRGSVEAVQLLIEARAKVDFQAQDITEYPTALFLAAKTGSYEKAKLLVKAKADVNNRNVNEDTATDIAKIHGHDNIVKLLIKAKAAPRDSWNQMRDACIQGRADRVEALLDDKDEDEDEDYYDEDDEYKLDLPNMAARYPLLLAVWHGHAHIVEMLIAARAQVNFVDKDDETPLVHSIRRGDLNMARSLLSAHADVNGPEKKCTALYTAVKCNDVDATRLLIDAKAYLGYDCYLALGLAAENEYLDVMQVLIDAKARLDDNNTNPTPLMRAVSQNKERSVRLLLDAQASLTC